MELSSGEISDIVFRRVVRDDLGDVSLDSNMLSVIMEVDGKTRLGIIAQKVGMEFSDLRKTVSGLMKLKLIEPVADAVQTIDDEFYEFINQQMSIAVGPIAGVLIEEAIEDMGHTPKKFPSYRSAELVDMLARDIKRDEKKNAFKQDMINMIKEKKY